MKLQLPVMHVRQDATVKLCLLHGWMSRSCGDTLGHIGHMWRIDLDALIPALATASLIGLSQQLTFARAVTALTLSLRLVLSDPESKKSIESSDALCAPFVYTLPGIAGPAAQQASRRPVVVHASTRRPRPTPISLAKCPRHIP